MSGIWAVRRRVARIPTNLLRAGAIGAAAIGAAGVVLAATIANAEPAPEPRLVEGNITTCQQAGLQGEILLQSEDGGDANSAAGSGTVSGDGTTLDVTINEGFTATGIAVKGGPDAYVYDGPFVGEVTIEGMVAPPVGNDNTPELSHWFVCGFETPPPTPTPTESPSPSPSPTESPSPSPTASPTPSPSPTASPAASPSATPGATIPPPIPELPLTGTRTNVLLGSSIAFLALGALLMVLARQRRHVDR